ncbi:MAG: sialate O-acetylesterase [Prevotella sp.]|nr:sialate O-acetylesterase [Prevotella sp.]
MRKRILMISAVLLTTVLGLSAKVRLPHLIADNMVIQQESDVRLWGWDVKGKPVTVTVSWSAERYKAMTDRTGKWMLTVRAPKASYTPLSITFDDGEPVTVSNVLAGEVWVCAGQSNMEVPVKGFPNCPIEGYNEVVATANQFSKAIHYCKVPSVMSMTPQEDAQCQWRATDMNSVADQSAVGFFFARLLNRALDIPVGLIEANKGGTRVESWLSKENLKRYTDEPLDSNEMVKKYSWDYHRPLLWGNGTFSPILNYTVKGILFYQGCSNVDMNTDTYAERLAMLVRQWRDGFRLGDIPFYFVQIAPCWYGNDVNGTQSAYLREQQLMAQGLIPNSDIVCTNDCVYPWETQQIHPCKKQPVGERLANIALNHDYGFRNIQCESSRFDRMEVRNDTCVIFLKNNYQGISRYEGLEGFEVAGADRVFHKAEASYDWRVGLMVKSKEVRKPVAVRYCFRNFQLGNVKNQAMLPLFPFRTDKW